MKTVSEETETNDRLMQPMRSLSVRVEKRNWDGCGTQIAEWKGTHRQLEV